LVILWHSEKSESFSVKIVNNVNYNVGLASQECGDLKAVNPRSLKSGGGAPA